MSKTPKPDPNAPLLAEHLRAAAEWALGQVDKELSERAPQPVAHGLRRVYAQWTWETSTACGTACCMHGAAHIIARGRPLGPVCRLDHVGPTEDDYTDLQGEVRDWVIGELNDADGDPREVLRLLDQAEAEWRRGVLALRRGRAPEDVRR